MKKNPKNEIGPNNISADEIPNENASITDIIEQAEKAVPTGGKKRPYTKRKNQESAAAAIELPVFGAGDFVGLFSAFSNVLAVRSKKWELTQDEIEKLSASFAPLATKYGMTFLSIMPEIMFGATVLNVVMARLK